MIFGEKIYLRIPENGDEKKILTWENHPDNSLTNFYFTEMSEQDINDWIAKKHHDFLLEKELRLMICDKKTRNVAGAIDLFEWNDKEKSCGTGIIIDLHYRKKGYATESVRLLIEHCFSIFGLKKIWCKIHPENKTSIQLFEKSGFSLEKMSEEKLLIFQCSNPQ